MQRKTILSLKGLSQAKDPIVMDSALGYPKGH